MQFPKGEIMNAKVAAVYEIIKVNSKLLPYSLKDISDDEIKKQPTNDVNSILFVIGHMLASRFTLTQMLGDNTKWKPSDLFIRGAKIQDASAYPSIDEMVEEWKNHEVIMESVLKNLSDDFLTEKAPYDFPVDDKSMLGGISFMAMHESYHIGQLAYIKKLLGHGQLVG